MGTPTASTGRRDTTERAQMKWLFKLLTFPFWFPIWVWKTSVKLAILALLLLGFGGYFYFTYFV